MRGLHHAYLSSACVAPDSGKGYPELLLMLLRALLPPWNPITARLLGDLAVSNPPAFICHYYNTYFAHTAGGRMIGNKVAGMCLDGAELEFYKYDGDLVELLESVRGNLNEVAEGWSKEEKDVCLTETMDSFKVRKHAGSGRTLHICLGPGLTRRHRITGCRSRC